MDTTKLPKWAQARIEQLERQVADLQAQARINAGETQTRVSVGTVLEMERHCVNDSTLWRFTPDPNHPQDWVEVGLRKDQVEVRGSHCIVLRPKAGNSVEVTLDPEW